MFAAVFGARSVATVIVDDDVAFVWDSRTSGDGTEAGSFEWYLGVGQHSFVVEYVEEAGAVVLAIICERGWSVKVQLARGGNGAPRVCTV